MNLLVLEPGTKLWGSERAFLATVPALKEAWKRVVVMTPSGSELASALTPYQVEIAPFRAGGLYSNNILTRLMFIAFMLCISRREAIDTIYLNQAGPCRLAHLAARLLRIPLVIHVRLAEDIQRCAQLRASKKAPIALIFVSKNMRELYSREASCESYKTLATAYDPFETKASPLAPQSTSRDALACVGRIARIKGQASLLEGLAIAQRKRPRLQLDLIGAAVPGDPYEEQLHELIRRCGLDNSVRFLGYRDDANILINEYGIVVVPSLYEPLGRVVFESWEAGALPICSHQSGGAAEIVAASQGGILYEGSRPEAIAQAILAAVATPAAEREAMVKRGRDWMRANLSIETYKSALSEILFPSSRKYIR